MSQVLDHWESMVHSSVGEDDAHHQVPTMTTVSLLQ